MYTIVNVLCQTCIGNDSVGLCFSNSTLEDKLSFKSGEFKCLFSIIHCRCRDHKIYVEIVLSCAFYQIHWRNVWLYSVIVLKGRQKSEMICFMLLIYILLLSLFEYWWLFWPLAALYSFILTLLTSLTIPVPKRHVTGISY